MTSQPAPSCISPSFATYQTCLWGCMKMRESAQYTTKNMHQNRHQTNNTLTVKRGSGSVQNLRRTNMLLLQRQDRFTPHAYEWTNLAIRADSYLAGQLDMNHLDCRRKRPVTEPHHPQFCNGSLLNLNLSHRQSLMNRQVIRSIGPTRRGKCGGWCDVARRIRSKLEHRIRVGLWAGTGNEGLVHHVECV